MKLEKQGAFDYNNRSQIRAQGVEQNRLSVYSLSAQQETKLSRCGNKGGTHL